MNWGDLVLFLAAGVLGGMVNALAGGAKLFVFPILLASGLPPIVANATGTVALWPAQIPAVWLARASLRARVRPMVYRMVPAIAGAALGAIALIWSSEQAFLAVIPVVLVIAVGVIILGRRLPDLMLRATPAKARGLLTLGLMFAAGFYGGYFGAGLGFLLIATISLAGVASIHETNAEKNLMAVLINTTAVVPLLASGLVHLPAAGGVLLGGVAGGYLGGRVSGALPEAPMRFVVAVLGLILTLSYLLG